MKIARSDAAVLVTGETVMRKELVARVIHYIRRPRLGSAGSGRARSDAENATTRWS